MLILFSANGDPTSRFGCSTAARRSNHRLQWIHLELYVARQAPQSAAAEQMGADRRQRAPQRRGASACRDGGWPPGGAQKKGGLKISIVL